MRRGQEERQFSLKDDIPELRRAIEAAGDIRLVVIDTIGNHMGKADRNKSDDVRAITSQLTAIARDYGLCVIGITHLKKGEGSALQRVIGSIDWTGAARAVWVADRSDESDQRKMAPAKVNHAADRTGYAYRLKPRTLENGIKTACIEWEDSVFQQTANQMLTEKREGLSRIEEAEEFLKALCPMPASQLLNEAEKAGITKPTLDRAKKILNGYSEWDGNQYIWRLPTA
jgi:hypothetical protein